MLPPVCNNVSPVQKVYTLYTVYYYAQCSYAVENSYHFAAFMYKIYL